MPLRSGHGVRECSTVLMEDSSLDRRRAMTFDRHRGGQLRDLQEPYHGPVYVVLRVFLCDFD